MSRFDDGSGEKTYVGGGFDFFYTAMANSDRAPVNGIGRLEADHFESIDRGLGAMSQPTAPIVRYDLTALNFPQGPRLMAGGTFLVAGGRYAKSAALFDGENWSALSLPSFISGAVHRPALATIDGQLRIVAGIQDSSLGLVGYWNDAQWVRLPVQPPGTNVGQIVTFNGSLHVFTNAGLFRFTGTSWQTIGSWSSDRAAAALGDLGGGERLYFAAQSSSATGVFEFDGANVTLMGPTLSTAPNSVHIHNDGSGPAIYVAGPGVQGIQRLRNGAWEPISPNFTLSGTSAVAMASFDDGEGPALYAAGYFKNIGTVPTNGFARWRNNTWSPVFPYASSPIVDFDRASLAVFNNRLYVSGIFTQLNGTPANHLAYIEACPRSCVQDFNNDGDSGTDADIEAFFQCLAGNCCNLCSADFNNDGDTGTDADIESFFRVLAGGPC
jgi:hypothetical protein